MQNLEREAAERAEAEAAERAKAEAVEQLRADARAALEASLHGQDSAALEEALVAAKAVLDESELQPAESALQSLRAKEAARAALRSAVVACGMRSGNELCIWKRSAFGLARVYNLLPPHIVKCSSVQQFQGALQELVKQFAVRDHPHWRHIFSPRLHLPGPPLLSV